MPGCAAPFLSARLAERCSDPETPRLQPWRPISKHLDVSLVGPPPSDGEAEARRIRRDTLAASARTRYEEWRESTPDVALPPVEHSVHRHQFRERDRRKELGSEWASASKVLPQHERIERAVAAAGSEYLKHPPYPKVGGGRKNTEFSYNVATYDYRQRLPSKEVAPPPAPRASAPPAVSPP